MLHIDHIDPEVIHMLNDLLEEIEGTLGFTHDITTTWEWWVTIDMNSLSGCGFSVNLHFSIC